MSNRQFGGIVGNPLLEAIDDVRCGRKHHALFATVEDTRNGKVRVLCSDGCFSLGLNDLEEAVVDSQSAVLAALMRVMADSEIAVNKVRTLEAEVRQERELRQEFCERMRDKLEAFNTKSSKIVRTFREVVAAMPKPSTKKRSIRSER